MISKKINLALFLLLAFQLTLVIGLFLSKSEMFSDDFKEQKEKVLVSVISTKSPSMPFQVYLKAFGQEIKLNLSPPDSSIFTDGFTYGTTTILKNNLTDVEKNIFVDKQARAALRVDQNEPQKIEGFINGLGIYHDEQGQHFIVRNLPTEEGQAHRRWCGVPVEAETLFSGEMQNLTFDPKVDEAILEIQVVVDLALANLLGSRENITNYIAVFCHAVNVIYATMDAPSLQVKLAGVVPLSEAENALIVEDTGFEIHLMLRALRDWMNSSPVGLGPSDHVALLTGVITLDDDGTSGVIGTAFVGATCGTSKVSVTRDTNAYWRGVSTLAHEMGHGMGAHHDFDTPCGELGNLMGYEPGTPNYYYFSNCSKEAIRERLATTAGSCLLRDDAGAGVQLGQDNPGNLMTFDFQCRKAIVESGRLNPLGYFLEDNPPGEACLKLRCRYEREDGAIRIVTFSKPLPAEGTSCNQSGGKCHIGYCV